MLWVEKLVKNVYLQMIVVIVANNGNKIRSMPKENYVGMIFESMTIYNAQSSTFVFFGSKTLIVWVDLKALKEKFIAAINTII